MWQEQQLDQLDAKRDARKLRNVDMTAAIGWKLKFSLCFADLSAEKWSPVLYFLSDFDHFALVQSFVSRTLNLGQKWFGWLVIQQSKMTMTSIDGWPLIVGADVAGESNPGSEGPPACGTHVGGC